MLFNSSRDFSAALQDYQSEPRKTQIYMIDSLEGLKDLIGLGSIPV